MHLFDRSLQMDRLKTQVTEYVALKDDLKRLTERKKLLEKSICNIMDDGDISTLELPDGTNLNYKVTETLSLTKLKAPKKSKEPKEPED